MRKSSDTHPHLNTRSRTHSLINVWFRTHFDVEEPGFEGVHLTGSFADVVKHQVESSGSQEVRVRATELFSTCVVKEATSQIKELNTILHVETQRGSDGEDAYFNCCVNESIQKCYPT